MFVVVVVVVVAATATVVGACVLRTPSRRGRLANDGALYAGQRAAGRQTHTHHTASVSAYRGSGTHALHRARTEVPADWLARPETLVSITSVHVRPPPIQTFDTHIILCTAIQLYLRPHAPKPRSLTVPGRRMVLTEPPPGRLSQVVKTIAGPAVHSPQQLQHHHHHRRHRWCQWRAA
ncbi:Hypothetical protein CINCED_3A007123 [Cinara cedri]|uniref:Secreted protein n=1 Tax=Cinara cedri TaxID=506608 RepID=A0A5E4NEV5_9HEMI|nr:Hypothetical protein CINCED_3A007123 [Cinara cedri]